MISIASISTLLLLILIVVVIVKFACAAKGKADYRVEMDPLLQSE